jgi:hypothetical protein
VGGHGFDSFVVVDLLEPGAKISPKPVGEIVYDVRYDAKGRGVHG